MKNYGNNIWLGIINMIYSIHSIDNIEDMCQTILKQIRWLVPFDHAMFILPKGASDEKIIIPANIGFSEEYIKLYQSNFQKYDYASGIKIGGNSIVYKDSDIIEEEIWLNSSFYQQFCKPNRIRYCAHILISYNNKFCGEVALYREESSINGVDFSANDIFIMNLLKEHLSLSIARLTGKYVVMIREEPKQKEMDMNQKLMVSKCAEKYQLTRREKEIMELLISGVSTTDICEQLMITLNTLKKHTLNLYKKMEVNSRIQLIQVINTLDENG